ncbi:helix-turn-helix domain-containing protein [Piscinibacter sakaiensis]|uniref:helix-turn-helix domain-containing protein n=1 Tax=Piscinibacter sakaiensis TaxID=1547922 RepID=UPI003AABD6C8
MSASHDIVIALKIELKAAGITYAELARQLGLAESSVKRIFSRADMPLSRIDDVLRVLNIDFAELAQRIADSQPLLHQLTLAQESAVVADRKLLLIAISCLSHWTFDQIVATYTFTVAECQLHMAALDRLGIIELRPMNRYRLRLAKTFRWLPDGPVMAFFRQHVTADYFNAGFDDEGELLMLVHGQIGTSLANSFVERLQRLGQDFAQQHLADQRLPADKKRAYTLVVGMRSWLFAAFEDLKRQP